MEKETGKKVYNVLQLREHEAIKKLKDKVDKEKNKTNYDIVLTYIISRGNWYNHSRKGDIHKSGGVATNIGVHFFDMLTWIFGSVQNSYVHLNDPRRVSGLLEVQNANVRWFLSSESDDMPVESIKSGILTHRSLLINEEEFNFSNGFDLNDARASIEIVHDIREAKVDENLEYLHPKIKDIIDKKIKSLK